METNLENFILLKYLKNELERVKAYKVRPNEKTFKAKQKEATKLWCENKNHLSQQACYYNDCKCYTINE